MKEPLNFIAELDSSVGFRKYIEQIERTLIMNALRRFECNVSMTARWLGFNNRSTLVERMKKFGIVKKSLLKGD